VNQAKSFSPEDFRFCVRDCLTHTGAWRCVQLQGSEGWHSAAFFMFSRQVNGHLMQHRKLPPRLHGI